MSTDEIERQIKRAIGADSVHWEPVEDDVRIVASKGIRKITFSFDAKKPLAQMIELMRLTPFTGPKP